MSLLNWTLWLLFMGEGFSQCVKRIGPWNDILVCFGTGAELCNRIFSGSVGGCHILVVVYKTKIIVMCFGFYSEVVYVWDAL